MYGIRDWIHRAALAVVVATSAFGSLTTQAGESAASREMVVLADFDISADGRVTSVEMRSPGIAPAIGELVANAARKWTFEPVMVDGVAAPVRTRASIKLRAEPVSNGYLLGIQGIGFGSRASATKMTPPEYPRGPMRQGVDAEVQLYVEYGSNGRVTDARVISTAIGGRRNAGGMASLASEFERAAKHATRTWRFEVKPEVAGGAAESAALWVPITFTTSGNQALVPVPGRSEVTQEILDRVASTPRAGNEPIALQSRVRLRQEVVGSTL